MNFACTKLLLKAACVWCAFGSLAVIYATDSFAEASTATFKWFRAAPDPSFTLVTGMNSAGTITGTVTLSLAPDSRGFVRWRDGRLKLFDVPGARSTVPTSINSSGMIAGLVCCFEDEPSRSFVRDAAGSFTVFNVPGVQDTRALDINDAGIIVGTTHSVGGRHGFVRAVDGTVTLFDPPNSLDTYVAAINTAGEICGSFSDSVAGRSRGFIRFRSGRIKVFDGPNSAPLSASDINNAGQIIGVFINPANSKRHGFIRGRTGGYTVFDVQGNTPIPQAISPDGTVTGSFYVEVFDDFFLSHGFIRHPSGQIKTFKMFTDPVFLDPYAEIFSVAINARGETAGTGGNAEDGTKGFLRIP